MLLLLLLLVFFFHARQDFGIYMILTWTHAIEEITSNYVITWACIQFYDLNDHIFFISLYFRLSWGKNIFPWALKSEIHYKCTKLSVPLICRRINWTCNWESIQSKFNKHQWPRDQSLTLECFDDSIFDQIYLNFKSLLHAVWNLAISSLKLRKLLC